LLEAIPPIGGKVGRPARRPEEVFADRAYDSDPHREQLAQRGIDAAIAERNSEHGGGLGIFRWAVGPSGVVERTISWLHQFPRLRIRYESRADVHLAFMTLACIVIRHRYLNGALC